MNVHGSKNITTSALPSKLQFEGKRKTQRAQINYLKEKNGWNQDKPKLHQRLWHHRWKAGLGLLAKLAIPSESKAKSSSATVTMGAFYLALLMKDYLDQGYNIEDKFDNDNTVAMHEIGHFLNSVCGQAPMDGVELFFEDSVVVGGQIHDGNLNDFNLTTLLNGGTGGKAMERLLVGHNNAVAGSSDGEYNFFTLLSALFENPKDTHKHLKAFHNRNNNATENIVKFPKPLVEELAQKLRDEKGWDKKTIAQIIEDYNLLEIAETALDDFNGGSEL